MLYLALGDSISIDYYTGVEGGGAVSQLARLLGAELMDLTQDGHVTEGVLADLAGVKARPDVITVTAGGNDLLCGEDDGRIGQNLARIAEQVGAFGCRVILNTIYDPTDGDDSLAGLLGLSPEVRMRFNAVNAAIRALAVRHHFLLGDLERLFRGHGLRSVEPWYVQEIEPNLAGATATARHWHELLSR